jgi:hypothetical protein
MSLFRQTKNDAHVTRSVPPLSALFAAGLLALGGPQPILHAQPASNGNGSASAAATSASRGSQSQSSSPSRSTIRMITKVQPAPAPQKETPPAQYPVISARRSAGSTWTTEHFSAAGVAKPAATATTRKATAAPAASPSPLTTAATQERPKPVPLYRIMLSALPWFRGEPEPAAEATTDQPRIAEAAAEGRPRRGPQAPAPIPAD